MNKPHKANGIPFLSAGGDMGAHISAMAWEETSLGPITEWPTSLRTTLSLILHASLPMCCFWGGEQICFYNDAFRLHLEGNEKQPVIGKKGSEAWPEIWDFLEPKINRVLDTAKPVTAYNEKLSFNRKSGKKGSYKTICFSAAFNDEGQIAGVLLTFTETTKHDKAQQRLEESERKFKILTDAMPEFIWLTDSEGNINYFNRSVYNYSGLGPEQLENRGWLQVVHPDDREENIRLWEKAIETGQDFLFEHRFKRHDGVYRWQLTRAKPQRNQSGEILMWVGISTDIQDQKMFTYELEKQVRERTSELLQLNESLKKGEQRYHLMVEEVQDYAILYLNRHGIVENWNTGAEKIKGYKADEIIGKSFSNFYTEEDRKNGLPQKLLKRAIKNDRAVQEGWRVRKDKTLFWASVVITAVHGQNNEVIGFSKVTRDLTAKKEADDALKEKKIELEQKNNELQELNKELQSFAYIASHDLQEPLRKIQTFTSRIAEKEGHVLSNYGKDLFARMRLSAERMQTLIEDLLAYSRTHNQEGELKKTSLRNIVAQVEEDLAEELLKKEAVIDFQSNYELPIIPFQIKQLFHNLITNSLKFSKPSVPLRITIDTEVVAGSAIENKSLLNHKNYCRISVSDNGIGFDQQYSKKIFELFQRLHGKSEYPGTGIGLAIIKRIVENHHGAITATGELGVGATFYIYLPVES